MTNKQIAELNRKAKEQGLCKDATKDQLIEHTAELLEKIPYEYVKKTYDLVQYYWLNSFDTQALRDEVARMSFDL